MNKAHPKEQINGIFLLLGENNFEKDIFISKLISEFSKGKPIDIHKINYDEGAIESLIKITQTPSLFSNERAVILRELDKNLLKTEKEMLINLIRTFKDTTTLVIITSNLSPYRFDKQISTSIENSGGTVKVFWKVFDNELPRYISSILTKYNIQPSNELINTLIERNGQNIDGIVDDVKHIKGYFQPNELIPSDKAISVLSEKSSEGNIFDLLSSLVKNEKHRAIMLLNHILEKGEDIFAIGKLIYSQLYKLVRVKKLLKSNTPDSEITKQLDISTFELNNLKRISNSVDENKIKTLLQFVLDIEKAIRMGNDSIILSSVESFIIKRL